MNTLLRLHRPLAAARFGSQAWNACGKRSISVGVVSAPRSVVTTRTWARFASSSSSRDSNNKATERKDKTTTLGDDDHTAFFERTVYVHPLSQIILEYLQEAHHDWLVAQQLDTALRLHRDGSFELKFPMTASRKKLGGEEMHRIWTTYDEVEKKHWLTVYRGSQVQERFLLQDNLLPAWNNNRKSLPERIHVAVDQMIRTVNERAA